MQLEVEKRNFPKSFLADLYHNLMTQSWKSLILFYFLYFLGINAVFGLLYSLLDHSLTQNLDFFEAFFFSVHTFTTIGYGNIAPVDTLSNWIVTFEIMLSSLSTAIITGLVFSKFSLPSARLIFSNNALISSINGKNKFYFRVANGRDNEIVGADIYVTISLKEINKEGEFMRRFYPLKLERHFAPLFALSWTIMHQIDESSPLFNKTKDELIAQKAYIHIIVRGLDRTNGQNVHSTHRYPFQKVIWGGRFEEAFYEADGLSILDYEKFHDLKDRD